MESIFLNSKACSWSPYYSFWLPWVWPINVYWSHLFIDPINVYYQIWTINKDFKLMFTFLCLNTRYPWIIYVIVTLVKNGMFHRIIFWFFLKPDKWYSWFFVCSSKIRLKIVKMLFISFPLRPKESLFPTL